MLRRKRMPPDLVESWETFSAQAARVEGACQALLGCLPVGRVEPAPVPVGLDVMRDELRAVAADVERWRRPEVERHWESCTAATSSALDEIEQVRRLAERTDEMQHVVEAISELVGTLEPWYDAERFWLSLRVRR